MNNDPLESLFDDVRNGRPVVLVDDKNRENEGDLMVAAECISPEVMNFMFQHGKGLVCISVTEERLNALGIPMQVVDNTSPFGTNFGVSFDLRAVATAGITAEARTKTILAAVSDTAKPEDFLMPGWVFPVCAVPGGVLKRRGQTEGSVDLARLAGLKPAGVICEIMDEHGVMIRGEALDRYCEKHQLKITSVDEICRFRLRNEVSLRRVGEFTLSSDFGLRRSKALSELLRKSAPGRMQVVVFVDDVDDKEHLAFVLGQPRENALVRIHSECLTGDVFGSRRCDCGYQLNQALEMILRAGEGVVIYLHQEGRGIGLGNKLRAYELQDKGLDTVDANIHLGFEADERSYRAGAQMLDNLGVRSVRLMTNNPEKMEALEQFGITVLERVHLPVSIDDYNRSYMATKKNRLGHLF
jgi:3,4-dihydroxy 2-butanone 4-phosphate synthase/GTP cyclohydrolase II